MFVPPVTSTGSPAALELAQRIVSVIQEYRTSHPDVSGREIYQALRIAERHSGSVDVRRFVLVIAVALLLAGLLFAWMFARSY